MSQHSDILTTEETNYIYENIEDIDVDNIFQHEEETIPFPSAVIEDGNVKYMSNINEYMINEVKANIIPVVPNVLTNEEFAGLYEFEVEIHPNGSKNAWVYSASLNKVYMNMRCPFPVDFKINNHHQIECLFIRITPVFSSPQFAQEYVCRCINHRFCKEDCDRNVQTEVRQHVIRCANSDAHYIGDVDKNERLCIRIPFSQPQPGTDSIREMFEFVCKNSCPMPGMNRRAIEIIFTLEDAFGNIKGRRVLQVRVCSCPKRDKEKDEKEHSPGNTQAPRGKKRKLEKAERKVPIANEEKEYSLDLTILGKQNALQVLKYCHDLMAGEVIRNENKPVEGQYRKCIEEINEITKKVQNSS